MIEDLKALVDVEPFQPFQIHMTSGSHYLVGRRTDLEFTLSDTPKVILRGGGWVIFLAILIAVTIAEIAILPMIFGKLPK